MTRKRALSLDACGDVLSVDELSRVLATGRNQTYQLVASGRIRSVKVGERSIRIPKAAVASFLEGGGG